MLRLWRLFGTLLGVSALACGHAPGSFCRADVPETGGCVNWVIAWCDGTDAPSCDSGAIPLSGTRATDVTGCTHAPEHENGRCL
jgi:hypothetical protein